MAVPLVRAVAVRHHQVLTKLALNSLSRLPLPLRVTSYLVANQSVVSPEAVLVPLADLLALRAGLLVPLAETTAVLAPVVAVSAASRR